MKPQRVRWRRFETLLKMDGGSGRNQLDAIQSLLEANGLDAGDLLNAILVIADAKKIKQEVDKKEQNKSKAKIIQDKTFIYPNITDAYIFRYGRTKSKNYYLRIYDEKTKKSIVRSLKTQSFQDALVKSQVIYREQKDALLKGRKLNSITTKELVDMYLEYQRKRISTTPHTGIMEGAYRLSVHRTSVWLEFITELKLHRRGIENIPPEKVRDYGLWLKKKPKQRYEKTERDNAVINHNICEIKRMYNKIALPERYLSKDDAPDINYLPIPREQSAKRDILEEIEYEELMKWMQYKYLRETEISEKEKVVRSLFHKYIGILYNSGMRSSECLGLRWNDIHINPLDNEEQKKVNRLIKIHYTKSKTGRSREIVAPITVRLDAIKRDYKKLGIIPEIDDFIFQNPATTRKGKNIPFGIPFAEKRLKRVLIDSGLQKKLEETGRTITLYSSRHFYCTMRLQHGVSMEKLALNMGTSLQYIQSTYSHIQTRRNTEELTKGMGKFKNK